MRSAKPLLLARPQLMLNVRQPIHSLRAPPDWRVSLSSIRSVAQAPLEFLPQVGQLLGHLEDGMILNIEFEQEADGRWLAEVPSLPGVMTYGNTQTDAGARVQAMALRVLAERLEHGEAVAELLNVTFRAA